MRSTASDFVGGDTLSCFIRPLQGCSQKLPATATLSELWAHCSDPQHSRGLFDQGHLPCEIGCDEGFADTAHRLHHYAESRCTDEDLPADKCPEPGCEWVSTNEGKSFIWKAAKFLLHHTNAHASGIAYEMANGHIKDTACDLSFRSKAAMYYHCMGGRAAMGGLKSPKSPCSHRDAVVKEFTAGAEIFTDLLGEIDLTPAEDSNFPVICYPLRIWAMVQAMTRECADLCQMHLRPTKTLSSLIHHYRKIQIGLSGKKREQQRSHICPRFTAGPHILATA
jgi:hypothetical protein